MNFGLTLTRLRKLSYIFRSKRLASILLFHRVLASTDHHYILKNDFRTIVDIGANRGQFTIAAKEWSKRAKIIAFEPLPAAARRFQEIFNNRVDIILHQVAIGPRSGMATLHLSALDDSSSLLPISQLQETLFRGTHETGTINVEIGPLSDYISEESIITPALLKIDVQGYELETLCGCETLLDYFSYIYVECSFVELYSGQSLVNEVITWLLDKDWNLKGIYNMVYSRNGDSIQADFLFGRKN